MCLEAYDIPHVWMGCCCCWIVLGWQLLYFDAPTRGEQLRLLFLLAGVPFEDTRLAWPAGLNRYKRAVLGDASPLMFDQVLVLRIGRVGE